MICFITQIVLFFVKRIFVHFSVLLNLVKNGILFLLESLLVLIVFHCNIRTYIFSINSSGFEYITYIRIGINYQNDLLKYKSTSIYRIPINLKRKLFFLFFFLLIYFLQASFFGIYKFSQVIFNDQFKNQYSYRYVKNINFANDDFIAGKE